MGSTPFRILMADDDLEDIELIERAIVKNEPAATVFKVSNGRGLIDHLNKQNEDQLPCLIVLDFNMPEINGSEVLKIICKHDRYRDIPKVILSTSGARAHIDECMNNGAMGYFVKPNNMTGLNTLAEKLLSYCREA